VPGQLSEASGVDGPDLLHKYPGGLSSDLGFRAERRCSGACRVVAALDVLAGTDLEDRSEAWR
jgi:hypothetical protein